MVYLRRLKCLTLLAAGSLILLSACTPNHQFNKTQTLQVEGNVNHEKAQSQIVNGEPVSGQDPIALSTVAFYVTNKNQSGPIQNFCTGTLIAHDIVLTAAHCFKDLAEELMEIPLEELLDRTRVGFGTAVVKNESDGRVVFVKAKQVIIHPKYIGGNPQRNRRMPMPDIALVQLETSAPEGAVPVPLGIDSAFIQKGISLTLAGYGLTSGVGQTLATQLMKVDVTISEPFFTSAQFSYKVIDKKSACMGDSGGPAYVTTQAGELVVVGVTSWGDRTCSQFGVYTSVPAFAEFIASAVEFMHPPQEISPVEPQKELPQVEESQPEELLPEELQEELPQESPQEELLQGEELIFNSMN